MTGQSGWEIHFIHALRVHLNIVIPSAILAVKLFIQMFTREATQDILKSIASTPLELMLIAMSYARSALRTEQNR